MPQWQPAASLENLRVRAQLNRQLRGFFEARGVLEVEVPLLARATVTDPHIDSIAAQQGGERVFLQTSPEFFMKRLLCAGSGAIYSLGKAFRNGEAGGRHNPEFTMLEWYRPGFDDNTLMHEVTELLQSLLPAAKSVERVSYRALFQRFLQLDPHKATLKELQALGRTHCNIDWQDDSRDTWLDLLMTHVIEPQLGEGLVLVYDYPASQAALARVQTDNSGCPVAKRFEAYVGGMELANGYWELTDAVEQARRFGADWQQRQAMGIECYPQDPHLVAALQAGRTSTAKVCRIRMVVFHERCFAFALSLTPIRAPARPPFYHLAISRVSSRRQNFAIFLACEP